MTTRQKLRAAIANVRYIDGHCQEERESRSSALTRLAEIDQLYGDLMDAIDDDNSAIAYNEVDMLVTLGRIGTHATV